MKVLMFNYEFPPLGGGAGNATYYILKEFSQYENLEIDLITSSIKNTYIQQFSDNIRIHHLQTGKTHNLHYQTIGKLLRYSIKAYLYAKKLVREKDYDLTHSFFGIPCGFISYTLKLPYIISLRGSDVPFYNKRFKLLDFLFFKHLSKIIWKKAKFVITNSDGLKQLAVATNPNTEIKIIPNGVNIEEFNTKNNKSNDKIALISTGRLIKRKGYEYLIKALSNLDNIKLILIGNGNIKDNLQKIAHQHQVDVEFKGEMDHSKISEQLSKADIFILPSLNEGMSNSVLEAMACGLPIITTNVGGSKELVNDNGFIVNKADPFAIRDAIKKYIDNNALILEHGKNSRIKAEKMSWTKVAKDYFNIYKNLVH